MKLLNYLKPEYIAIGLTADSKEELLTKMVDLASKNPHVLDKEKVRTAILERERIMSTGVGSGFAIPHGKTDAVSDIVAAFAVTAQPIDYQSLDDQPVRLVFLLVGRDNMVGPHIKLLSRISRLMNKEDFRKQLLQAETPKDVLEIFRQEEATISEG